jgi:hypothetical protein
VPYNWSWLGAVWETLGTLWNNIGWAAVGTGCKSHSTGVGAVLEMLECIGEAWLVSICLTRVVTGGRSVHLSGVGDIETYWSIVDTGCKSVYWSCAGATVDIECTLVDWSGFQVLLEML